MGIEPTYPAWKAGVLPLNYTRERILSYHRKLQNARGNVKIKINLYNYPYQARGSLPVVAGKKSRKGGGPFCFCYLKCPVRISTNSPVVGLLKRGQGEIACKRFLFPLSQHTVITVRRSRSTLPALV